MIEKIKGICNAESISRRELITGAGKLAAGAAIVSAAGVSVFSDAEASKEKYPWPYKKLDVDEVGRLAYENYFTKFCAHTVITGLIEPLRKSVGNPYRKFPIEAIAWAHGGIAGWGTACGTLIGAGLAIGLIAGKDAEKIVNDLMFYYSDTTLPIYKPARAIKADIKSHTMSGTPICHVSVGRWMKEEGVGFFTNERMDRCARVSADIAMQTARLLNALADGTYTPSHKTLENVKQFGITAQQNCTDCHGNNVPRVPGM